MKLANVIPATNISGGRSQIFSYSIPDDLQNTAVPGTVVEVPFGKRSLLGVVESISESPKPAFEVKPIGKIIWPVPIVTPQLIELAKFLSDYYVAPLGLIIKFVITKRATRVRLDVPFDSKPQNAKRVVLTPEQNIATEKILARKDSASTFLLHGVTGSGKTEVYLAVIEKLIAENKQALILVPEIALTPQTRVRFTERFGEENVAVIHSKISYGKKSLLWEKLFRNEIKILIGPRSALFAPFSNLGILVIDEEHDSSHKQYDQKPRLHVRTACQKLSELWNCPLVLGDATPQVETFYAAESGLYEKLALTKRYKQELPVVSLVDMREESKDGNFSIFSRLLTEKINSALARDRQIILLLNRRGTASTMTCKDCGSPILCQRCEVPVVYHDDIKQLVCHHCERRYDIPISCPDCGSHRLHFTGTGTEKVESEIKRVFNVTRIKRVDRDSLAKRSDIEDLYKDFKAGKHQILVGTQLLAKGWDLASVGLIGVINADTTLSLPDFRSNERTFQLITQVAGRAGRGEIPGEVVLQTYNPENFAIGAAVNHDYQEFYDKEIADRREFNYPPFCRLIKLTVKNARYEKALSEAESVAGSLRKLPLLPENSVIGPSPAFISKTKGQYAVHVIIKLKFEKPLTPLPVDVRGVLAKLQPNWTIDVDPDSLL